MCALPQQNNEVLLKAFALRAFFEMDWEGAAPPRTDTGAWLTHWQLFESCCNYDWNDEILALANASWPYQEQVRIADMRRYVEMHKASVQKSVKRHRELAGWE